mgnify:CR=1 FL=1
MAFVEDFAEFFETDEFAVEAQFAGANVGGIFEESFIEVHGVEGLHPVFTCVQADVASIAHGDAITIGGATYHVHGVQKDGTGLVALVLEDQT